MPEQTQSAVETITIQRNRRVHAIVDESVTYTVRKDEWIEACAEHGDEEAALEALKSDCKAERKSYEVTIDDITAEHLSEVYEV